MTQIGWIYADFFTGLTRFAGLTGLAILRRLEKNPKDFLFVKLEKIRTNSWLKFVAFVAFVAFVD
jgi:hypothetical protein